MNESGARRFWPGENPIGKRVWFGTTTGPFSDPAHAVEIVGVAGDVKYDGVDQPDRPDRADFYTSYLQFCVSRHDGRSSRRAAPATSLLPAMRTAVASVDPALPIYDAMTLDERIGAAVARPRFNATLLGGVRRRGAAARGDRRVRRAVVFGLVADARDRRAPRARRRRARA